MTDDDFLVRFSDSKGLGLCADGQRRWFAERGLDFRAYVQTGVPASVMLAQDDENARRVVTAARVRDETEHG